MFQIKGKVVYYQDYVIAKIDQQIIAYYMSLIPRYINLCRQRFPAHVTISRKSKENPSYENWGYRNGDVINIECDSVLSCDSEYYFLNCYSNEIIEIRNNLGLPDYRVGFDRFHITIGNLKGQ